MIERDDPSTIDFAHQTSIDPVLWMSRPEQLVATDELSGVRREHLDTDAREATLIARFAQPTLCSQTREHGRAL
jgi:hypothetical protein